MPDAPQQFLHQVRTTANQKDDCNDHESEAYQPPGGKWKPHRIEEEIRYLDAKGDQECFVDF